MSNVYNIIAEDWKRYGESYRTSNKFKFYLTHSGAKFSLYYRLYKEYSNSRIPFVALLLRIKYHCVCVKYGCDIPSKVNIGSGICLPHTVGIVINSNTVIGKGATIMGGVCIGRTDEGGPVIGNNVYIGANACIIGPIVIGNNSIIGAGSVVTKDVLEGQTVVGNPARVL